jgi:hypothetical protein
MKKITIKFIHPYPPYNVGDIATFFEREADRLTDRGFAMYVSGKPEVESQADRLKALRGVGTKHVPVPPQTRHIPGPEETKKDDAPQGPQTSAKPETSSDTAPKVNRRSQVEGAGKNKASRGRGKAGKGKK